MDHYGNSVYLIENLCKGCTNCINRCPTQAIRVRNNKAVITPGRCIDCGECIRICPHHAKKARRDFMDAVDKYKYTVALPAPSLCAQFNHLEDINILLTAIKNIGFNDVFEVSAAAEIVSEESRKYIAEHKDMWPLISTACPTVVRLVQVRFPNLCHNLLPLVTPAELAGELARKRAVEQTGLSPDEIGIFFLSPCASKVTAVKNPIGTEKSNIDEVIAIKDIYPVLLSVLPDCVEAPEELSHSGKIGLSWGVTGGEVGGLLSDSCVAADGIENVIHVLEDLEDDKFSSELEFIELNACSGGCVGGVMNIENPFAAKAKMQHLRKYLPVAAARSDAYGEYNVNWNTKVEYQPVFELADNLKESMEKMAKIEELTAEFPGLDCGCCGAPTCKALAEDIVKGLAKKQDCIHILREYIHKLSEDIAQLSDGV